MRETFLHKHCLLFDNVLDDNEKSAADKVTSLKEGMKTLSEQYPYHEVEQARFKIKEFESKAHEVYINFIQACGIDEIKKINESVNTALELKELKELLYKEKEATEYIVVKNEAVIIENLIAAYSQIVYTYGCGIIF